MFNRNDRVELIYVTENKVLVGFQKGDQGTITVDNGNAYVGVKFDNGFNTDSRRDALKKVEDH